jgi:hypothetical protein
MREVAKGPSLISRGVDGPKASLRKVIHDRPMLPEDIARASFPGREHLLDLAKNERAFPEELPPPREMGMDFGCLGLPHAFVAAKNVCRGCPSATACEAESREVLAEVEARFGSATPAADRKRMQANIWKASQRARERAKKADSGGWAERCAPAVSRAPWVSMVFQLFNHTQEYKNIWGA